MPVAMKTITAQVPLSLAEEVDALAAELERPRQWVMKKALTLYLASQRDRRKAIREGLDDVDGGRTVSMDAMDEWLDSLDTSSERPAPQA
ncbi:MAG: ribbon-helix-helix, copG family protein [Caballeronia sp.]|jgi:predicted transcriptional regulator|uniref:CopG family ribbon-helix-helix protein n=1 Tax=Caballeronia sp. TaxID=1931223 RepID=UPI002633ADF1|nr:ribbon-helix-helix protein, CopG family [Caballeronia sp.]MDB5837773.1 ribbon-helix-helix, copG family protein [Caballeronia sp.]